MWNVGLVSNEIGYLIEISKQGFEGVAWLLFTTYGKMREERDKLKSLLKRNYNLKFWNVLSLLIFQKMRRHVACQSFHKEMAHDLNKLFQQKLRIEVGLYQ